MICLEENLSLFFSNLFIISFIYFHYILSLPSTPLKSFPASYLLTSCSLSLSACLSLYVSLSCFKTKQQKLKKKQKTYDEIHQKNKCNSWAWGLPWIMFDISSVTPLKNNDFSSACSYQLQIAYWLGMGLVPTSPSCWYFVWLGLFQASHILSQALWVHLHISHVVFEKGCFLEVFHHFWLYNLSSFSSTSVPEPRWKGFDNDIPLGLSAPRTAISAHCPAVGVCFNSHL